MFAPLPQGLDKVRKLLELEINDYLMDFKPPMVDTYSFYGYGEATEAGFIFAKDITPEDVLWAQHC